MLDQSFSQENFRKIIDIENRKGVYLEGAFFPEIATISHEIKDCTIRLKNLKRRGLSREDYEAGKLQITNEKEVFKEKKENLFIEKLIKVSEKVTSRTFKIHLDKDDKILDKPV